MSEAKDPRPQCRCGHADLAHGDPGQGDFWRSCNVPLCKCMGYRPMTIARAVALKRRRTQ